MTCPFCQFLEEGEREYAFKVDRKRIFIGGCAFMIALGTPGLRGICPECQLHLVTDLTHFVNAFTGSLKSPDDLIAEIKKAAAN